MSIPALLNEMIRYFEAWPSQSEVEAETTGRLLSEMRTLGKPHGLHPNMHPVVAAWFEQSLALAPKVGPASRLINALAEQVNNLHWVTGRTNYVSQEFSANYSFAQIIGQGTRASSVGLYDSDTIAVGFTLQGPGQFYPPHYHSATEYYGVLSGAARWQREDNQPEIMPAGSTIFHLPDLPHAMQTINEPLLNIFVWTGDMSGATYFSSNTWLEKTRVERQE